MSDKPTPEMLAFMDLKSKIVKEMFAFTDKYSQSLYPRCGHIIVDVLQSCLEEAQWQISARCTNEFKCKFCERTFHIKGEIPCNKRLTFSEQYKLTNMCPTTKIVSIFNACEKCNKALSHQP